MYTMTENSTKSAAQDDCFTPVCHTYEHMPHMYFLYANPHIWQTYYTLTNVKHIKLVKCVCARIYARMFDIFVCVKNEIYQGLYDV